jgi:hypothetical protein
MHSLKKRRWLIVVFSLENNCTQNVTSAIEHDKKNNFDWPAK